MSKPPELHIDYEEQWPEYVIVLRHQLAKYYVPERSPREYEKIGAEFTRLQYENTKLRKLVLDMWLQLLNAYDRKEVEEFADRVRELGIEVGW